MNYALPSQRKMVNNRNHRQGVLTFPEKKSLSCLAPSSVWLDGPVEKRQTARSPLHWSYEIVFLVLTRFKHSCTWRRKGRTYWYIFLFFLSLHHRFFWTLRFQTEGEIPRRYSYLFAILRRNWRAYWSQPVAGRREPRVYAGTTGHVLRVYPCRRKQWRSAYCMYTL